MMLNRLVFLTSVKGKLNSSSDDLRGTFNHSVDGGNAKGLNPLKMR